MEKQELLRSLPQADKVLASPELKKFFDKLDRSVVLSSARCVLEQMRQGILSGQTTSKSTLEDVVSATVTLLEDKLAPKHYNVINATGIILNTSLGRAPFAPEVSKHIYEGIKGYVRLAAHPETGKRFDRDILVGRMLAEIFGTESATFVNNNAAATYLVLSALTAGTEVIVSRGQLVEIGGKFRIPDVMAASGAKLVEVGATNRTHLRDYENAITENTGAILRVHTSNYRIKGFTSMPGIEELAPLAHSHDILCIDDIGSGQAIDFVPHGLPNDYPVFQSVEANADIVCFSGDKLLGSVQSGIILGADEPIQKIRKHPLARAFRVDKMTVLGLEATMRLYYQRDKVTQKVPALRMLFTPLEQLKDLAHEVADKISHSFSAKAAQDETFVGGGSLRRTSTFAPGPYDFRIPK
ncbi:MAG: L-seryl-tRNA(Sec) selenium transferase [Planctomycetota bacterium]|nr:L-seryl-tRNA(Sec) selenium transferase [Planctomycetota bacterium]